MAEQTDDPHRAAPPWAGEERRPSVGAAFEAQILANIRSEIDAHTASDCPNEPKAILLNVANFELLGWDEVLGLPVFPDERPEPMRARLVCGSGKAGYCEEGEIFFDEEGRPWVFVADEG